MSTKLLKLALAGLILLTSSFAHASLISHSGYTLDTETNIVSGETLEWLQWDETAGLTVEQVLNDYDGWSLANSSHMAQLFSDFFPEYTWLEDENLNQDHWGTFGVDGIHTNFVELFGATYTVPADRQALYFDEYAVTSAYFGYDDDQDGAINAAYVRDGYGFASSGSEIPPVAVLYSDWVTPADQGQSRYGVALVRTAGGAATTVAVPEPNILAIFALGLLALGCRRLLK
ncbi:PEP-CTERM sorting domain-containing protein [Thalassomonas haliotis]|uniref:PEP-CTERM sorting domain-containing protein n=1 Tax=Thalassomonas haliotis TaxID=485448 RepID=A0ABY7VHZ8_9GAMM|nr:PEP-CTERM sorting domain-containing protein [Thalassomonas haliotis]WDE13354.1 PEP-CTERM sorting domain-containing protein [Thalassomonas haliotis]